MITSSTPAEITLAPTTDPASAPAVPALVHADDLLLNPASRTRRFVGAEHGSGISYFFVDYETGQGTDLHWHPYPETWVVLEGEASLSIGERRFTARVGDTATVPTGVWHRFTNPGEGRLKMLCIHASPVIIQTWAD
ncbi:mannose-6-phosphate isomerase-like protein (cupin superfamily) [Agromyces terreus]|uniref:Mannose-6-phosphate isomerase-like protein (Cupin superfamily) n=1 Tax=Agromyces terreus TaxID=424795 RepID=A0A9X2GYV0_9MICO|nr:cupin domain-containing protein [Agromyces terreus]MCP2369725.1 mannose-6-phosphate isomerase-like protein (cupin superfamily) [Agromyces terreus]